VVGDREEGKLVVAPVASLRPSAERSPPIAQDAARWMGHPAGVNFAFAGSEWDKPSTGSLSGTAVQEITLKTSVPL
jgi:hypothetical protein